MKIILTPQSAYWYFRTIVIHVYIYENKEHLGKKNFMPYLEQTHSLLRF